VVELEVEAWDGTSWTEVSDVSAARGYVGGATISGGNASGIIAGGSGSSLSSATEIWSAPATFNKTTEGQLYFNSTTNTFKETITDVPGASWSSGGSANRSVAEMASFGTQTAAMAAGGYVGTYSADCEIYNGSSWTEIANLNNARGLFNGAGTTTAGIVAAGHDGSNRAYTETWDGSSWTEVGDVNQARLRIASAKLGTSTSTLIFGGEGPGDRADTELWDGSSWTEVSDLNDARVASMGSGTATAAICAGGQPGPGSPEFDVNTEIWNGSSWTEVNNLNSKRTQLGGSGPNTAALAFGGNEPPVTGKTEVWNGTSWTELGDLSTARKELGGAGASSASALAFMGDTGSRTSATEEWTASLSNKTITAS
jgi:hypothetical protein